MKKRLLAVLDLEESYTTHIIDYLNSKMNDLLLAKGFTNIHDLMEFCETTVVDILLISEREATGVINESNIKSIIALTTGEGTRLDENIPMINKYQSADKLIKEVLEYSINTEETFLSVNYKNSKIIGIYSPVSGCGKTTFAITMAHIYSKTFPTLYINAEEFSGLSSLLAKDFTSNLSDLFYFYKNSPNKFLGKIFTTIHSIYDIDFIPPLSYSYDLRNIESEEWKDFIFRIIEYSNYEVVIIDLSNMVKDVFSLLEFCSIVFMPIKNDYISRLKLDEFEEFITQVGRKELLDRIVKVEIPLEYLNHPCVDYIDHVLLSPFTNYVRTLIKESDGMF